MAVATLAEITITIFLFCGLIAIINIFCSVLSEGEEELDSKLERLETEEESQEESSFASSEEILTKQENQYNEYTEVPAPGDSGEADNENAAGAIISVSVVLFLVVAAVVLLRRTYLTSKIETMRETCTVTLSPLAECESAFAGNVESYLQRVGSRLQNRMSKEDKDAFRRVEICAQAFDSMNLGKSETLGRIQNIYMPALTDITERIAVAPTQTIVENLMPYFHRHCDVLREAMEYELSQYQKRATMEAEAEITAVENFSYLKHDTDDDTPISLSL